MARNMSFGDMQQELYKFTAKCMLPHAKQADLRNDIIYLAEISDTFWTEEFDCVLQAMERVKPSWDDLFDRMSFAIEGINENMIDWYGNVWNFPPGYTAINLPRLNTEAISWDTLKRLANKIAPETVVKIKEVEQAQKRVVREADAGDMRAVFTIGIGEIEGEFPLHLIETIGQIVDDALVERLFHGPRARRNDRRVAQGRLAARRSAPAPGARGGSRGALRCGRCIV